MLLEKKKALMTASGKQMIDVVWNQLRQSRAAFTTQGITISNVGGVNYLNGVAAANIDLPTGYTGSGLTVPNVVYIHGISGGQPDKYGTISLWSTDYWGDLSGSTIKVYSTGLFLAIRIFAGASFANKEVDINVINLTQMFGAGNEPTMVAQFEEWLTENGVNLNQYIPYNAGEIRQMTKPSWII